MRAVVMAKAWNWYLSLFVVGLHIAVASAECEKVCFKGDACGSACIDATETCSHAPGAACNGCLVHCKEGQPCGDSCISADKTCTKPPGHACGGPCCKTCSTGKACGDACIAEDSHCDQPEGCACDADHREESPEESVTNLAATSCKKMCFKGVPCGNACVESHEACHVPEGSACMGCLVHCKAGKPCGDSCISLESTCTKPKGHACGACCKTCHTGKACGDTCIAEDAHCDQPHGCACNAKEMLLATDDAWQGVVETDLGEGSIDRINQKLELAFTQVASHESNNIALAAIVGAFASLVGIALAIAKRQGSDRLGVPLLQDRP